MLTPSEARELERLEEWWRGADDIPEDEVDPGEWRRMLSRMCELREKREVGQ